MPKSSITIHAFIAIAKERRRDIIFNLSEGKRSMKALILPLGFVSKR